MSSMKRWRGLKALAQDAVLHGSDAIKKVQLETAARPFALLEHIEPIERPVRGVHALYEAAVSGVHGSIRVVTRAVSAGLDVALDALDDDDVGPPT